MEFCLILLLCALLPTSFSAHTEKNVKNFRVITWNSNGGRWDVVADLMKQTFLSGGIQRTPDLIAIQEAGSIRNLEGLAQLERNDRAADYFGGLPSLFQEVRQYEWRHEKTQQTLYLYYIELVEVLGSKTTKQNLAIVSRTKANSVHMMRQEIPVNHKNPGTAYKYRPSLGVEINGAYFFSVHPRPMNTRNEANEIVDSILDEMTGNLRGKSWLVVGDFNREPQDLTVKAKNKGSRFRPAVYRAHQRVVATATDKPTRGLRRLDYGVVGGPEHFDLTLNIKRLRDVKTYAHGSDHEPVLFNF